MLDLLTTLNQLIEFLKHENDSLRRYELNQVHAQAAQKEQLWDLYFLQLDRIASPLSSEQIQQIKPQVDSLKRIAQINAELIESTLQSFERVSHQFRQKIIAQNQSQPFAYTDKGQIKNSMDAMRHKKHR